MSERRVIRKKFAYGDHTVTLETGKIAHQASGAVLIDMDGTTLLVTAVVAKRASEYKGMVPLSVFYTERMSAGGRIPGGFFKREGRPNEVETLISRLIDRPLRPLFAPGFTHETQVIATLLSLNPSVSPDVPAMIGASAALALSGAPVAGPIAAARVGRVDDEWVLNPSAEEMETSALDLIVAGTDQSVIMVEAAAHELSESAMLEAVVFGHGHQQVAIQAIQELVDEAGRTPCTWAPSPLPEAVLPYLKERYGAQAAACYTLPNKQERVVALNALRDQVVADLKADPAPEALAGLSEAAVLRALGQVEARGVRENILSGAPRIDGRTTTDVRPISTEVGLLSRAHGDALFTRGETQAWVNVTMGTSRDAQLLDLAAGERKEHFMLHYNFPPFSVGETGMVGSPKRREIGHGRLARRALEAVMPDPKIFPYVVRVVSDITACNGSSSMATVCGSSMALMQAGIPLRAPVAGIAMGLILEGEQFAVLSDILGDEDHLGDMDFKVAGTDRGVTALQMDLKVQGITKDVMQVALEQAREGRLHILGEMAKTISSPNTNLSEFAPRVVAFSINPEKIRDVIGKGGATIRSLTETYNASIDISDEGLVSIVAVDAKTAEALKTRIELITAEVEVGQIYQGPVARIMEYGAFVTVLPGKDGLVHVSQIAHERIEDVNEVLEVGQTVSVKVLEIDRQGRIRLSMKEVTQEEAAQPSQATD